MKRLVAVLAVLAGIGLCFGPAGCDDAVCDDALQKLRDCAAQVNCNNVGPEDRSTCVSNKKAAEDAADRLDGVPCVADISSLAEQVNRCDPRPGDFCKCF